MTLQRGHVVIAEFPQGPGNPSKRRPAVIVQSNHNNTRLTNSIFAMITGNTTLATTEPTQVLIDISTPDGSQSGLNRASAVKCENLYTLPTACILRTIGYLPPTLMQQVDAALKSSLALP